MAEAVLVHPPVDCFDSLVDGTLQVSNMIFLAVMMRDVPVRMLA